MQEIELNQAYSSLEPEFREAIGMKPDEVIKQCVMGGDKNCNRIFNITIMNTVARWVAA